MKVLSTSELISVGGGDRWGDGQDQLNHPAPDYSEPNPLWCLALTAVDALTDSNYADRAGCP